MKQKCCDLKLKDAISNRCDLKQKIVRLVNKSHCWEPLSDCCDNKWFQNGWNKVISSAVYIGTQNMDWKDKKID